MHPVETIMQVAGTLAPLDIRAAIRTFQEGAIASGVGQGQEMCPLRHTFVDGVYAREITMFEGQTVVGKIHKHAHLNFISKGRVRVLTEQEGSVEYVAPVSFISQPGTKRLVHILEDCVWTTIHKTNKTDPDEAVAELTVESYDDIEIVGEYEVLL